MAKIKKTRNKKYNTLDRHTKHISYYANKAYEDIYFLGDKYHKPEAINGGIIKQNLRGLDIQVAQKVLTDHLITCKNDWTVWVGMFFESSEGTVVSTSTGIITDSGLCEYADDFHNVVEEMVNVAIEQDSSLSKDKLINYAYFFSHCDYDFDVFEESLIDRFFAIGVMDIDGLEPFQLNGMAVIDAVVDSKSIGRKGPPSGKVLSEMREVTLH